MKVLVLGATGLLGREVHRELREQRLDVVATGGTRSRADVVRADAHDPHDVRRLLSKIDPDVVVNCVGERRPEQWSAAQLYGLNVALPRVLAGWCETAGSWLVHVSSDYVFDGRRPPHAPGDRRRPLNPYGKSKADGEDAAHRACESTTILRVPVLHGPVEHTAESNLTSMVPLVMGGAQASVDDWAIRHPTFTPDVATVIAAILAHRDTLAGMVCHWSGTEPSTKYEMARAIGNFLDLPTGQLQPDRRPHPARPRNPQLDCRLLEELGIGIRTSFEESLPVVIQSVRTLEGTR